MGKQLPYEYRKSPPVLAAIMISGHFGFEKLKTALRPALGSYANFLLDIIQREGQPKGKW